MADLNRSRAHVRDVVREKYAAAIVRKEAVIPGEAARG